MKNTIIQAIGNEKQIDLKTDYDIANDFVNDLIKNDKKAIVALFKKHRDIDVSLFSDNKLRKEIKSVMKAQDAIFINDLASYIAQNDVKDPKKEISRQFTGDFKTNMLHAVGGAWKTGEATYNEALKYLVEKKGYESDEAESYLRSSGESSPLLVGWKPTSKTSKKGKDKGKNFDWNKAMDTTSQIAQTVFLFGSLFSKKEDEPIPTRTESDSATDGSKNKMVTNVIIIVLVVAAVSAFAYFAFKTPK